MGQTKMFSMTRIPLNHKKTLRDALVGMTQRIMDEKIENNKSTNKAGNISTTGDEVRVVQRHLHTFLLEILPVVNTIVTISGNSSSSSHSSSECQMQLSIEPERRYFLNGIVGKSGKEVSGGTSDFSLHHTSEDLSEYSLGVFEAKKTQLNLSNLSGDTKSEIAQAGFQMLGEIQKLQGFVGSDVPEYRSMLTNGLVWLQVMMQRTLRTGEMSWRHSQPMVVVKMDGRTKEQYIIQEEAIDLVVDHLWSVLVTANSTLQLLWKELQYILDKVCYLTLSLRKFDYRTISCIRRRKVKRNMRKRAMIMKIFMIAVVSMVPIKMMLMSAAVVTILWDVIQRKGLAIPQAIFTTVLIASTAKRLL